MLPAAIHLEVADYERYHVAAGAIELEGRVDFDVEDAVDQLAFAGVGIEELAHARRVVELRRHLDAGGLDALKVRDVEHHEVDEILVVPVIVPLDREVVHVSQAVDDAASEVESIACGHCDALS